MAGNMPAGAKGRGARQVQARELARERAVRFAAREQRLQELAADYFVLQGAVAEATAEAERRIEQIRADLARSVKDHQDDADDVILDMLQAGASIAETAERLGVPQGTVRRVKAGHDAVRPASRDAGDADAATSAAVFPGQAVGSGEQTASEVAVVPAG